MEISNKIENKKDKMEKKILTYLQKTSKHLFIQGTKFYRVIPFQYEGKWYYVALSFNGTETNVEISEALSDNSFKWYGSNSLKVVKTNIFPEHNAKDRYAIKNFKAWKEKFPEIMETIKKNFKGETGYGKNQDIKEKIKETVKGIEPKL